MSDIADQSHVTVPVRRLLDEWTAGLAQVVASMADQKPDVRWEATGAPPAEPELLWWEQPLQFAPGMTIWIATPANSSEPQCQRTFSIRLYEPRVRSGIARAASTAIAYTSTK